MKMMNSPLGRPGAMLFARSLLSAGDLRVARNQANAVANLPAGGLMCELD